MIQIIDILRHTGNDKFAKYVVNSRISGRVLNEFNNMENDTKTELATSVKIIEENHSNALSQTQQQINAILEIQSQFEDFKRPIFIKGSSAAILCNSKKSIRFSKDIDLFYDDIPLLKNKLRSLGYREINKTPAAHEDSFFEKNDIFIEIHKSFPVLMELKYPQENLEQKKQLQMPDIEIKEIKYDILLSHSVTMSNTIVSNITLTDPAMTVFLLSAHMYKNLFWEPYRVSKFRLSEIFEIYDLIHLPHFDFSELEEIAELFQAKHILNYTFSIMGATLNEGIPEHFCRIEKPLIKLMNASYSPYMITDSSFLSSLPYITFEDLLKRIGYAECAVGRSYYSADFSNVFYASMTDKISDFCFKINDMKDVLNVHFYVSSSIKKFDNFFVLLSNNYFAHIWLDDYPKNVRVYGKNIQYNVSISSETYVIDIYIPASEHSIISVVLAKGEIDSDMQKKVTVLPIKIKYN